MMNSVLILAVMVVVLFAFIQGLYCFLLVLPEEKFKDLKRLTGSPLYYWIFFSYLIVMSFSLAGFYWFVQKLINCIKIG